MLRLYSCYWNERMYLCSSIVITVDVDCSVMPVCTGCITTGAS